jgi:hypothetical protein
MPRFCMRGCGNQVNGKQKFCGKECRNQDKRERMQEKRQNARKSQSCPTCGRAWPKAKAVGA